MDEECARLILVLRYVLGVRSTPLQSDVRD